MIRTLLVLIVVAGLVTGGALYLRRTLSSTTASEVPTYVVARDKLVRKVTAEGNLRAVKATPLTAPQSASGGPKKLAWIAPDGQRVKANDVVAKFDASDPEKELRDGRADLEAQSALLRAERLKSGVAVEARDSAALFAAKALEQTRQFQSKDATIYSRNEIIESEIDEKLATAQKEHAESAKQIERKLLSSKVGIIEVERRKAEVAIKHAETELSAMEIRAPHDGLFVLRRNWRGEIPKVGDQLWPGQELAELPLLDAMEAEVFVLEIDGSALAEKQVAEVVIEARPGVVHPATVRLVDKLAKPRVHKVPVQYFAVVLALASTDPAVMKPGQRVRATITIDATEALVVPRQAVMMKDGKSFVYRKTPRGDFEQVPVELGEATSGRIMVKSGLAAGDRIALRDPTRSIEQTLGGSGDSSAAPAGATSTGGGAR
jgi:RND family efflux transporter MFP subunit